MSSSHLRAVVHYVLLVKATIQVNVAKVDLPRVASTLSQIK